MSTKYKESSVITREKNQDPKTEKKVEIQSNKQEGDFFLLSRFRGALMGFASLWIIFFHEWIKLLDNHPVGSAIEGYIKSIGFCGVDIFLLVSGIGLYFSMQKKTSLPMFYYKRFKRIVLPFITVAVVRSVIEKWPFDFFINNISGINFYKSNIYYFLWFVPAIITLYIFFPLYYRLFSRSSHPVIFTFGAVQIWLVITLWVRDTMRGDLFGFTNRIPIFIIGVLFGWLIKNVKIKFSLSVWTFFGIMLILGGYLSYLTKYKGMYILVPVSDCCFPDILMAVSLSLLMAKGFDLLCKGKHIKVFGNALVKVLAFFGTFSLEFYCIQEWLGGRIITKMTGNYDPLVINLAVLAAVTAVSFPAHLLFNQFWKAIEFIAGKLRSAVCSHT